MEYTELTDDYKRQILKERILSYEAEHYQNYLNKQSSETLPDGDEKIAAISQAETNMAAIEVVRAQALAELESLPDSE